MTILAIIKGRGREAIDAATNRQIDAKFVREDIFGCSHLEIDDCFIDEIHKWYEAPNLKRVKGVFPIGTVLFFTQSKTEA